MHSFQPSRGKIFFEVLCALTISASCAAAWMQTGASALLGAAGTAALYGLIHLFDMRRPKPTEAVEPQRIDFEPEAADIVVPMMAADQPTVDRAVANAELTEPAPSRAGSGRRSGGSRKGSGRRAKVQKQPKAAEPAPAEPLAEDEFAPFPEVETAHPHIAPLFEPEPFARMPRPAFGRRGRL